MDLKKIAVMLFWALVIFIALPIVSRFGRKALNETKDDPFINWTGGFVNDLAKTALGNTGSGGGIGGFGSSGSRALDAEKNLDRAKASVDEAYAAIDDSVIEAQAELDRAKAVQKRKGLSQEWHPRITWKNAVAGVSYPIAVVADVYRVDLPGGPITVAQPKLNRGDPPTNLESILVDGGQYSFQAYVGNTPVSGVIGPWMFVKGRGWQSPSGRTVLREPVELLVTVP